MGFFFFTLVCLASKAYLQYGSTPLSGSLPNVTLTVGIRERLFCVQATGPVPTSIEWYNPQGQLVSRNGGVEVNQAGAGGGRIATLNFQSYRQSQGGKYECRVTIPGKALEKLPVLIGQCQLFHSSHKIPTYLTPVNYSTYCTYYASVIRTVHVVSKEVTVCTYVLAKGF